MVNHGLVVIFAAGARGKVKSLLPAQVTRGARLPSRVNGRQQTVAHQILGVYECN